MRPRARFRAAWCAAALLGGGLVVPPAPGAVKSSSPAGFLIENSEVVPVDAATAWRALVEEIDRWWPRDHTWWGRESKLSIEPRAGGCFCEIAGERQAHHENANFIGI